jgi:hypothetical protein
MTQMLERTRPRRRFARADILAELGETIFLPELTIPAPAPVREQSKPRQPQVAVDEDPERWDGMS